MSNKFNLYKQNLVNFFQDQKYIVYGKTSTKKITYLYSKDAKIPVIKIEVTKKQPNAKFDSELDYLKQQVSEQLEINAQSVPALEIYLSENFENNYVRNNNTIIVITNSWDYLTNSLSQEFPNLANLEDPELTQSDSAKINDSDFNLEDIKTTDDLKKRLGQLNQQLRNGNAMATMIIAIFFLITPFVIALTGMFLLGSNPSVSGLVFGGTTYSLTFLGGQWWRIFTYGFSGGGTLFTLIFLAIIAWISFRRLRLSELMMGTWKMLATFIISYLILGFFTSVLGTGVTSGASGSSFAIIIGMMALNAGGSKSALATTAKQQIIWPIVVLIFYGLMIDSAGMSPLPIALGFIAGGTIAFMFTYDYKDINWRISIGIILILALILVPIAMLIVPSYVPGTDSNVVMSLGQYINLKFMSVDQANKIIDKIGWDHIEWNKVGSYWPWISFR